jgi:hypothetical protein
MIEFMRGMRTPLSTAVMAVSARMVSNRAGVIAVAIADDVFHLASGVLDIHGEVACGLGHPRRGRMGGGAEDMYPAGGVLDDLQHSRHHRPVIADDPIHAADVDQRKILTWRSQRP